MKKDQHGTPKGNLWQVIGAGNSKPTKLFNTQKDAIVYGREIAINQGSELVIHDKHGKIRDKDSFGNDPYPPKDTKY